MMIPYPRSEDPAKIDISTDGADERFLSSGQPPHIARLLIGIYHCARGPVSAGGRGLSIESAIEHALSAYLKPRRDADNLRPSDPAQLAAEVARELRKRGIWARVGDTFSSHIVCVPRPSDCVEFRWYSMHHPDFDNLTPIEIAESIRAQEAQRAKEWAGDK